MQIGPLVLRLPLNASVGSTFTSRIHASVASWQLATERLPLAARNGVLGVRYDVFKLIRVLQYGMCRGPWASNPCFTSRESSCWSQVLSGCQATPVLIPVTCVQGAQQLCSERYCYGARFAC